MEARIERLIQRSLMDGGRILKMEIFDYCSGVPNVLKAYQFENVAEMCFKFKQSY